MVESDKKKSRIFNKSEILIAMIKKNCIFHKTQKEVIKHFNANSQK